MTEIEHFRKQVLVLLKFPLLVGVEWQTIMKRIYASLGVAAIGVASIQGVHGQSSDPAKSWSASASLRGFYDDNVNTAPSDSDQTETFGFEVSPSLSFALPLEQTTIAASYTYSYKWYDEEINNKDGHDDNTHTFAASLRHNFSERLVMSVRDSFVVGQEPDVIRVGNTADATYQRISGDNIRNYGAITFNAQITRPFGIEVGYANSLYDYDDDSDGGYSSTLDRLEHEAHIDGRWYLQPDLVGILGYQFSLVDYTADLPIAVGSPHESDVRNNRSHYVYAGLEHNFRPNLVGSLRAGARFNDYYNSPSDESGVSPYTQASLTYEYAVESRLEVGTSHDRRSTDQSSFYIQDDDLTLDADTTLVYVSLTHRIVPNLFGSVIGNFQYSTFNEGPVDGDSERYYGVGVNLRYHFNRHLSAEVGYNYDKLDSDSQVTDGDYDRNRVYIGATFTY